MNRRDFGKTSAPAALAAQLPLVEDASARRSAPRALMCHRLQRATMMLLAVVGLVALTSRVGLRASEPVLQGASPTSLALQLGRYLSHDGDADGDGVSSRPECDAFIGQGRGACIRAALDARVRPTPGHSTTAPQPQSSRKTLGIVLYPGFEVLDVYGPLEMWSYVPEFKVVMIAEQAGPVRSGQGISTVADYSFTNAPPLDIVMVPGGLGSRTQVQNPAMLEFLREQHKRTELTTSVCTGSALLARAGILKGHKATSNKAAFSFAVEQDPDVDWIVKARWVEDGKIITSSGVSAGTDMALGLVSRLYGKERAQKLAKSLEYEWHEDPTVDPFALSQVPRPARR